MHVPTIVEVHDKRLHTAVFVLDYCARENDRYAGHACRSRRGHVPVGAHASLMVSAPDFDDADARTLRRVHLGYSIQSHRSAIE